MYDDNYDPSIISSPLFSLPPSLLSWLLASSFAARDFWSTCVGFVLPLKYSTMQETLNFGIGMTQDIISLVKMLLTIQS